MIFKIIIHDSKEGEVRLDRFLKRHFPNLTQGIIEKSLRNKLIKVNDKIVKSNFKLLGEEKILIKECVYKNIPEASNNKEFSQNAIILANKILTEYLIHDNPEFIAINKPSKLPTQGGSKINLSVDDALSYLNSLGNKYKLVHRIDKDTSGILLIARGYNAATKLTKAFHDKNIQKRYLAIIEGKLPKANGEIKGFISKNHYKIDHNDIDQISNDSKFAITKYKLIKKIADNISLVEFIPITGRMHQIRIHAREIGCPIIGDKKYNINDGIGLNKKVKINNYMLLHAANVLVSKEIFGSEIKIEAMLPSYFKKIIDKK